MRVREARKNGRVREAKENESKRVRERGRKRTSEREIEGGIKERMS